MILKLELQPRTVHERPRVFTWDSEAGTFEGNDAEMLRELCETYAKIGLVIGHPYPMTYPCTDPFHNPAHLAVLLAVYWRLPEELERFMPEPPAQDEIGANVLY